MFKEIQYRFNCGQYVLHEGDDPIAAPRDNIALAFDKISGTLHKHGEPENVKTWHANAVKRYMDAGFDDMASDLIVIEGRFPLDELNKCISTSGYVARMYEKLLAGQLQAVSLFEFASEPQTEAFEVPQG